MDDDFDDSIFDSGRRIYVAAAEPDSEAESLQYEDAFEPSALGASGFPGAGNYRRSSSGAVLAFGVATDRSDAPPPRTLASADVLPIALIEPADDAAGPTAHDHLEAARAAGMSWGIAAVGADRTTRTGAGVTVAVLDTGIDASHAAFAGADFEIEQRDFTRFAIDARSGRKLYSDDGAAPDTHGHGTHCAGTIFGQDVDGVRIGVARGIDKALIGKVLGPKATTEDLVAGIEWAIDRGADIISMSLNFDLFAVFHYLHTHKDVDESSAFWDVMNRHDSTMAVLERLVPYFEARAAAQTGRASAPLIVAATGNQSRRPDYVVTKLSPATAQDILSVGAVGQGDAGLGVAPFSNTRPDLVAPGVGIVSAAIHFGPLGAKNGTSMACPHVAGLAALHWEKLAEERGARTVTADMVRRSLNRSVTFLGPSYEDLGEGMPGAPD